MKNTTSLKSTNVIAIFLAIFLGLGFSVPSSLGINDANANDAKASEEIIIPIAGTERYDFAYKVLTLINKERTNVGLTALKMTTEHLNVAMTRAAECQIRDSGTRPNGLKYDSLLTNKNVLRSENIAFGQTTPEQVVTAWMKSSAHKANILRPEFKSIGIGCFAYTSAKGHTIYSWTQVFSDEVLPAIKKPSNQSITVKVSVNTTDYPLTFSYVDSKHDQVSALSINNGSTKQLYVAYQGKNTVFGFRVIPKSGLKWETGDEKVATVSKGKITSVKVGSSKITALSGNKKLHSLNVKIVPKKTSISSLTRGKKKLTVKWKKVSGTTKYQVRYKLSSSSKWTTKTVSSSKTSLSVNGLRASRKYNVQVRSYKTVNEKMFYSPWTATKSIYTR